jgi:hypothetical protein
MASNRKWLWLVLLGGVVICWAALVYPMLVIQPFRAQESSALATALEVRRFGPPTAALLALLALWCAWRLGREGKWWARSGAVLLGLLAAVGAGLGQINIFERMFHRIDSVETLAAGQAALAQDDMVLAVAAGGQARAYPIRMMGYHHIVNDWVGGVPLVGTY